MCVCVGSSAHTPLKYTHVECLRFQSFRRLWWIQTPVSQSLALWRGVIHSFELCDLKHSPPPPHVFSLPLSSEDPPLAKLDSPPRWLATDLSTAIHYSNSLCACAHATKANKSQTDGSSFFLHTESIYTHNLCWTKNNLIQAKQGWWGSARVECCLWKVKNWLFHEVAVKKKKKQQKKKTLQTGPANEKLPDPAKVSNSGWAKTGSSSTRC